MTRPPIHRMLWAALALALLVRLLTLGLYPLADTTEARYAEIARKMIALGDWITPWYDDGVPFWAKPPLSMWVTAASMKLLGVNEFAARLPHVGVALLMLWLLWDWLRARCAREAQYAVTLLAGTALFYIAAGAVMTDITLALGLLLVLRGFWNALHGARRREGYAVFLGLAIGLLAKGPIALVLAGLPLAGWTLLTRNGRALRRGLPWRSGLPLLMVLVLPWYIAAELKTPGFLDYFLVGEHWQRFTVAGWAGDRYGSAHDYPRGSIWLFALVACLPWVLLLPMLLRWPQQVAPADAAPADTQRTRRLYLVLWSLAPCVFFTGARNILWTYVLPALPALAALVAERLATAGRAARVERALATGVLANAVVLAVAVTANHVFDFGKSAAAVVQAYAARRRAAEPLLFFGDRPYSAVFYSRGHAERIVTVAALSQRLAEPGPTYVAVKSARAGEMPGALRQSLRDLGTFGGYCLYVHFDPAYRARPGSTPDAWP